MTSINYICTFTESNTNHMNVIDINKLCEVHDIDTLDLARVLFPSNNRPDAALARVAAGVGSLDSEQIAKLAQYIGCEISQLYSIAEEGYKALTIGRLHLFRKGGLNAIYNADTRQLSVYVKNLMVHSENVPLSARLGELLEKINNAENQN